MWIFVVVLAGSTFRVAAGLPAEIASGAQARRVRRQHAAAAFHALTLLQQAVEHGLDAGTKENIASDASLKLLHSDPRFAALVAEAKKGATSGK